jgi:hypothetical protein
LGIGFVFLIGDVLTVIAGLVPAIHVFNGGKDVDPRD